MESTLQPRKLLTYARENSLYILIILIIISPIILSLLVSIPYWTNNPDNSIKHIDTLDYHIDDDINISLVWLKIEDTGSVTIIIEPDLDFHFHAEIRVFGKESFLDSPYYNEPENDFNLTIEKYTLKFFSSTNYWSMHYELIITISSDLRVYPIITDIEGDINLSANSANIISLWLRCDYNLKALFSNVVFDYGSALSARDSIEVIFLNSSFQSDHTKFYLDSSNKINLRVEQELYDDDDKYCTVNYKMRSRTVNCIYGFSSAIGVGLNVTENIESENIATSGFPSPLSFPYISDNYNSASLQFFFDMGPNNYTNNGSISITAI